MIPRSGCSFPKLLLILLLICAMLGGCVAAEPTPTEPISTTPVITDPPPSESEQTEPTTEPTEPHLQIYTLPKVADSVTSQPSDMLVATYDEGSYTWHDAAGNQPTFTYRIPSIVPFSYGAIAVQQEINDQFRQLHDEQVTNIEELYSPYVLSQTYDAYCANGVLSVVLTRSCDWDRTDYYVYNMDIETGERLNDTQLLKKLEIDEDDFIAAAKLAAKDAYIQYNGSVEDSYDSSYSQDQLDLTLSIENLGTAQLYVDNDGKLWAAMDIYSIAGANSYTRLLEIEP